MTPGDPRIANLFVLLFASLMAWLLWRFGLRKATTASGVRETLPFFLVFGAFLLVNALWSASHGTTWARVAELDPVETRGAFERLGNQEQVLVAGRVGQANRADARGVVYLLEDRVLTGPLELIVRLEGTHVPVTGVDMASRWNWDTRFAVGGVARSWLRVGQRVVVWGTVEHGQPAGQPDAGPIVSLRAALVFSGTAADFRERALAQSERIYPRVLAWLSLAAALIAIGMPFVYRRRFAAAPVADSSRR